MEVDFGRIVLTARRLWKILILAVLMLGMVFASWGMINRHYSATTQLLVSSKLSGYALVGEGDVTSTFESLATSDTVLNRVIRELSLELSPEQLRSMVFVSVVPGTQIIEISVGNDDAELAAQISNSIATSLVASATDLALGETQRHLDELTYQVNTARDRITSIDAQLELLNADGNVEDAETKVRVDQLQTERFRLSQLVADIDSQIRTLTATISTSTVPIVIVDSAAVPTNSVSVGPLLLGVLGLFLGVMASAVGVICIAYLDRKVRSVSQVSSIPNLMELSSQDIVADPSPKLDLLASLLAVTASKDQSQSIVMVSPRADGQLDGLVTALSSTGNLHSQELIPAEGILEDHRSLERAGMADTSVLMIRLHQTTEADVSSSTNLLGLTGSKILGAIYVGD